MAVPDIASVTAPCNIDDVPDLLSEVAIAGEAFSKSDQASQASRLDLLAKLRQLTHALETPREIMIQHTWTQPTTAMAINFGIKSGLWAAMAANGKNPQKVSTLARQLGMQEELLQRMMRHIAAAGYLDVAAPDEYKPNRFSRSLALDLMNSGYLVVPRVVNNTVFAHAHDWLRGRGYTVSTDKHDTAYQVAHGTKLHWFEHLQSDPTTSKQFNDHMQGYLLGRPAWTDVYPAQERVIQDFDSGSSGAVLLVDIAGGLGHYTEQFRANFPDAPGRFVLEDLPVVIQGIADLHDKIERVEYDFFTEQPIKGARAYFTHFVLHDWPDEDCVKIVSRIRDAMRPGYSKFLVHEHVLPDADHDCEQTALDLIMMVNFGSKERTAAQWSDLLERMCGMRIVKIWPSVRGCESVVECERPE